ncbi:GIY-YIG nuclease family protein [Halovenus sp. WSH3]|uniref:GIY-YIG nuclease family protein n=1 Tax=Halovenus carboxidivorans TaxID=2692199 RepID=A0A6B0SXS6_9EURY|nr:GIY-YIG nuclease family protein [Halovenus carboxidivorans]MXR50007.1 GIY-YIG nuclease family protein [Halovenus carboxidivorans]
MPQYVYVVECADGSLYTGYTTDVGRRVEEHNAGDGAKYTAGRRPVSLRYVEYHPSRSAAQSREHAIKSLSRSEKDRLLPDADDRVGIDYSAVV